MSATDTPQSSSPGPAASPSVVIIGAGPAGLTAAYQLSKSGVASTVLEADSVVGGISRTAQRDGWRFDIGGHRFFTKVGQVEDLWHEILDDEEFLTRPRMSRIYYQGKYYDYPIKVMNALRNLGPSEAVRCVASALWVRARPIKDIKTLEDYVVSNYGRRLYHHFFKAYNEKVWGVSAKELSADWGAQRIKGMSIFDAIWEPVRSRLAGSRDKSKQVTSLIEQFKYPKFGPGMMWERCRELVEAEGTKVIMQTPVTRIRREGGRARAVVSESDGVTTEYPADHVVSSMPFPHLVRAMDPPAPAEIVQVADDLTHRDFMTVALVVPEQDGFPDNWIYIHAPEVNVGRIQNFGTWSPYMVKDGRTCLGLEYFLQEGGDLWNMPDDELVAMAKRELGSLGLVPADKVEAGFVVRMPKAYPVYDEDYTANLEVLREWIEANAPNVWPVGRNGMHRYNNQDHSMLTAMLTVENILGDAGHDIWAVNVDEDYHEVKADSSSSSSSSAPVGAGGGRSAPITPKRARS